MRGTRLNTLVNYIILYSLYGVNGILTDARLQYGTIPDSKTYRNVARRFSNKKRSIHIRPSRMFIIQVNFLIKFSHYRLL
jgi:hypothetical protein